MDELLQGLRAAGEATRLRIVAVLSVTELTVSELCRVLGQTQPRVSRHLKLMCEGGLLERHAEGTSAFYRPAGSGTGRLLFDAIVELVDQSDPVVGRDRERLAGVRAERAAVAAAYFESVASDWDRTRSLHVADADVETAMLAMSAERRIDDFLDIGTGTGRMLEVFADRARRGLGIDLSPQMLNLARSNLDTQGLSHCSVRHGNVYDLDLDPGSFDLVVLHQVLHFLDDPATAVAEAARTLRPNGGLLLVDFAPHSLEWLRTEHAHRRLGFDDAEVTSWCTEAGLVDVTATHLTPDDSRTDQLTVTLWSATQHPDAPALYTLEAAS